MSLVRPFLMSATKSRNPASQPSDHPENGGYEYAQAQEPQDNLAPEEDESIELAPKGGHRRGRRVAIGGDGDRVEVVADVTGAVATWRLDNLSVRIECARGTEDFGFRAMLAVV